MELSRCGGLQACKGAWDSLYKIYKESQAPLLGCAALEAFAEDCPGTGEQWKQLAVWLLVRLYSSAVENAWLAGQPIAHDGQAMLLGTMQWLPV